MKTETDRLILREMTYDDYDALYNVLADSDVMCHYPCTFDEKRVRGWIEKNIRRYAVFGFGLWAVCLGETGEMIGDCGLTMQSIDGMILHEIGYHIAKEHRRQGFAREAASAVRDLVFANTPFHEVFSYMRKDNLPSSMTARSIGMSKVEEYNDDGRLTEVRSVKRENL